MTREDRARRIVFSTDNLFGGTGTHILNMTKYWDSTLWQLNFICKARKTAYIERNVPIDFLPRLRSLNRYPVAQLHEIRYFYSYLRSKSPDIVHSFFFWPILYGRILKLLGVIKILVENREDEGFDWGRHEYMWLNLTRSMPDCVICVSESVRREVMRKEKIDPDRIIVIHNGTEPFQGNSWDKSAVRGELGLHNNHLVVGMVANYNLSVKGASYFLDSIPTIIRTVPNARFLILGRGGHEEGAMREKARSLGIESFIIFAGYKESIHKYYSIMDISVLTSLSEGLSITVLESMSHGLPVVVTRVGGNPEVVEEGQTGYLVPPKDIESFSDRVIGLLLDQNLRLRMGEEGRKKVEEQFRLGVVAERYLQVYSGLLETTISI